ncbi:MAG: WYL domain-containing protein [Verrucomicrobiota bacterium]
MSAEGEKTRAEGTRRPLERVMRIHDMIRRGQYPNCTQIAKELGLNRKTIQRDINFMRDELELPLAYDDTRHGYHYTQAVTDFPFLETTAEDLVAMILARNALDPLRGSALESTLRTGFQKLQATLRDKVTIPWSDLDQAFSVKSTGMTEHDVFQFNRIAEGVLESRELHFDYQKLSDESPMRRHIQPYHLAEVEGGWYVIGYDLDREARRTFAVQRMKAVHLTRKRFVRRGDFRLEDHLAGSFGVWAGDDGRSGKHLVRIRFRGFAARVVAERRWHPTQEITPSETEPGAIEMSLQLSALEDITRWILGFGGQAEALAPDELRERLATELREASALYDEAPLSD